MADGTSERCLSFGLSLEPGFDCSGLVIDAFRAVTGDVEPSLTSRHVRDMWANPDLCLIETKAFRTKEAPLPQPRPGDLLVTELTHGSYGTIAGHIAIITAAADQRVNLVHTSRQTGFVEEIALHLQRHKVASRVLGILRPINI